MTIILWAVATFVVGLIIGLIIGICIGDSGSDDVTRHQHDWTAWEMTPAQSTLFGKTTSLTVQLRTCKTCGWTDFRKFSA
jgi:hypothetical protein